MKFSNFFAILAASAISSASAQVSIRRGLRGPSCVSRQAEPGGECNGNQHCADESEVCGVMQTTFQCDCEVGNWLCLAIDYAPCLEEPIVATP
jgi:hypothetical protein